MMQEIATPLSRLAMTSKWDSNGSDPDFIGLSISNIRENYDLTLIFDNGWTSAFDYQGSKLLLDADLVFNRIDQPVNENKSVEQLDFMFDAHLQFGNYQDHLDYYVVAFTYRAVQTNRNLLSSHSFQIVRDQLELGKFVIGQDHTLNVDYYAELQAGRVCRFWDTGLQTGRLSPLLLASIHRWVGHGLNRQTRRMRRYPIQCWGYLMC
jgi:hypothetical protein